MAPPLQTQEAGRRFPGGLTGNALLSGIIAAIVSGLISFYVVHWQSQAAARQAVTSQQVAAAVQLQSAAETFDQVVDHLYWSDVKCAAEYTSSCDQTVITNTNNPLNGPEKILEADLINMSDNAAKNDAAEYLERVDHSIRSAGSTEGTAYWEAATNFYYKLIGRCAQIIQGHSADPPYQGITPMG